MSRAKNPSIAVLARSNGAARIGFGGKTVNQGLKERPEAVETIAEVQALSLEAGRTVYLTEPGRSGLFNVLEGAAPNDPTNAIFINLANGNHAKRDEYSKTFSMRMAGATGDGITSDQAIVNGLKTLITAGIISGIEFDDGYTFLLDGETEFNLEEEFTDVSGFTLCGGGKILATGANNTLTIKNGWHPKIDLRFEGGGDDWDTSTAVRVIGCYHPITNVVGSQYAGTLLQVENGLSSGSGGNGRFESERLVAVNCGRLFKGIPSPGSASQNGFGYVKFFWDANSKVRSSFESTQDISIGFCNVGLGATSSAASGLKFDGANSISINMLFVGEVTPPSDAPSQRQFVVEFNNGSNVKIGHFFHIVESGASTVTSATVRINSVDGFDIQNGYINGAKGRVFSFSDTAAGNDLGRVNINAVVKNSGTEVSYFDATADGAKSINLNIDHENCAQDGLYIHNCDQVPTAEINLKTTGESPVAAGDLLAANPQNNVNLMAGSRLTAGTGMPYPVKKYCGHQIEEQSGLASIGAGALTDVVFGSAYFTGSAEVFQEDDTGGPLDLVQYNYTGGLITGARVRNRGAVPSGTWKIRMYGSSTD